jgi:hypothetical protein
MTGSYFRGDAETGGAISVMPYGPPLLLPGHLFHTVPLAVLHETLKPSTSLQMLAGSLLQNGKSA